MTEQELINLEIERRAYLAVVWAFVESGCDVRMEAGLNEFLCGLENKAREIEEMINKEV